MRATAHNWIRELLEPLRRSPFHPQWLVFRLEERKLAALGPLMSGTVVDVGCGEQAPRRQIAPGGRYIGLDHYQTATEWYHTRPDLYGDAQCLPLVAGSAHCVLLLDVLILRYEYPAVSKGKLSKTILLTRTKWHQASSELSTGVMLQSRSVVVNDVFVIVLLHWSLIRFVGFELSTGTLVIITIVSAFAGLVSFTPMGLGTYDAAITYMLVQYGIPIEAAIAVPLVHRIGALFGSVPLGLISGIRLGIDPRKRDWVNRDMQASKSSAPVDSTD